MRVNCTWNIHIAAEETLNYNSMAAAGANFKHVCVASFSEDVCMHNTRYPVHIPPSLQGTVLTVYKVPWNVSDNSGHFHYGSEKETQLLLTKQLAFVKNLLNQYVLDGCFESNGYIHLPTRSAQINFHPL